MKTSDLELIGIGNADTGYRKPTANELADREEDRCAERTAEMVGRKLVDCIYCGKLTDQPKLAIDCACRECRGRTSQGLDCNE